MHGRFEEKNGITAIRIDDRLLHGIITTQWVPRIPCDRVMVIDDVVAGDPLKKEVMRLSKPMNKALSVIDRESAVRNFRDRKYQEQRVFILSRDFRILSDLMALGYHLPTVNIGMYFAKQGDRSLAKRIILNSQDVDILCSLLHAGCSFVTQYVPSDEPVKLNPLLEALS